MTSSASTVPMAILERYDLFEVFLFPEGEDEQVDYSNQFSIHPLRHYLPGRMWTSYAEASHCGNETRMQSVNDFLKQFKEIFSIYDRGGLSEETYKTVVADLLSHLRE